jgi:hypothetical protein
MPNWADSQQDPNLYLTKSKVKLIAHYKRLKNPKHLIASYFSIFENKGNIFKNNPAQCAY